MSLHSLCHMPLKLFFFQINEKQIKYPLARTALVHNCAVMRHHPSFCKDYTDSK